MYTFNFVISTTFFELIDKRKDTWNPLGNYFFPYYFKLNAMKKQ